ncbi:MAG: hypothetical protein K2X32_15090 [Phycisphaerales bacterium]|nr:hypothetical protein [Phycisphaerales bacterium]
MTTDNPRVLPRTRAFTRSASSLALSALAISLGAPPTLAQNSLFAPCAQWKTFEQAGLGETLRGTAFIDSLVTFDLDGPGPGGDTVLATTGATLLNGQPAASIIRWNGATWVPVPTPPEFGGETRLWVAESPDGTGRALYATSRAFITSTSANLYRWNGTEFALVTNLGLPAGTRVFGLTTFDADGPSGPAPRDYYLLAIDLDSTRRVFRSRSGVAEVIATLPSVLTLTAAEYRLIEYTPTDGGQRRLVLAGPSSSFAGQLALRGVAAYDGTSWGTIGDPLFGLTSPNSPTVTSLVIADPDGAGPVGETLVIGGRFRVGSETGPAGLAYLQGDQWVAMGAGLTIPTDRSTDDVQVVAIRQNNLSTTLPRLAIVGNFTSVDNVSAARAAILVGQTWQPVSTLEYGYSWSFPPPTTADFDGLGGNPTEFVFGNARRVDTQSAERFPAVAFDGAAFRPLASRLVGSPAAVVELRLLPDETGTARLHAAGTFNYAGGRFIGSVAKLVNGSWQAIGTPLADTSVSIVAHDFDGPGPQPRTYVRLANRSGELQKLFILNGQDWAEFATTSAPGAATFPNTLESFDPDGDGPAGPVLAGTFSAIQGGALTNPPSVLVGSTWRRIGVLPAQYNVGSRLVALDDDGPGGNPARLHINAGGLYRFDAQTTDPSTWESVPWTPLRVPSASSALAVDRASPSSTPGLLFDLAPPSGVSGGPAISTRFSAGVFTPLALGYRGSGSYLTTQTESWDPDGDGPEPARPTISPVFGANIPAGSSGNAGGWTYRASIAKNGRWYGLGALTGFIQSHNGLLAYRTDGDASTEYLLQFGGRISFPDSNIFAFSTACPCSVADIADDQGNPLPGAPGVPNNGVTEGDYNHFFGAFFNASATCDIADDQGNPLPAAPNVPNNGVTEADYNCFFSLYFNGCP